MNFWPVGEFLNQLEVQLLQNYNRDAMGGGGGLRHCSPHMSVCVSHNRRTVKCVQVCVLQFIKDMVY